MNGTGPQFAASLSTTSGPLAQGRLDSLGNRFRHGGGEWDWWTMLLVVAVLAISVAVVWMVARYLSLRESGGYHSHRGLFRELCRAHRLSWNERRLLALVARQQGVVVPARLFIEPERFDPGRFEGLHDGQRRRIARLYETLFQLDPDGVS